MSKLEKMDFEIWCRDCNEQLEFRVDEYEERIACEPCPHCVKSLYNEGYDVGKDDGFNESYSDGDDYDRGYDDGYEEGRASSKKQKGETT